jgi:hypothetical protein
MSNESQKRAVINMLAKKYAEQTKNKVSFEDARKRVVKAILKGEK